MADAVRYCSTDIDGPGLPPAGSQASRLFAILHACLVTGYGDKPGQGWELVHNGGDDGFTLLSPDGVYVCFSYWGSTYSVDLYLAESLAPPFQYPPVGINVRSQDWSADYTSSVTTRHRVSVGVGGSSNISPKWWQVVARGAQVLLFSSRAELTASPSGNSADGALYLGNLKLREGGTPVMGPQNFVVVGGNNATTTATGGAVLGTFSGAHTRLRHPLTGVVETGGVGRTYWLAVGILWHVPPRSAPAAFAGHCLGANRRPAGWRREHWLHPRRFRFPSHFELYARVSACCP